MHALYYPIPSVYNFRGVIVVRQFKTLPSSYNFIQEFTLPCTFWGNRFACREFTLKLPSFGLHGYHLELVLGPDCVH
jgi:hypothetical protein